VQGKSSLGAQQPAGLRRRWIFLLPAVFITYSLAYLDRTNYGFGAAAGLAQTLHISASRSALLGSLFFLGYFLFQIPGAAYAQRKSATRLVFFALIAWGALAALTGIIHQFWLLAIDRMLLGVAESLILPSMLILLSGWFTRAERSRASAILILGNPVTVLWMSAVTGYLIKAFGWQMTFVFEGIPSILWAFVWALAARDHPHQSPWMDRESCELIEGELAAEQTGLPELADFRAALRAPGVRLLSTQYFFWSISMNALVLWLPTMIRLGSARGIEIVGLLNMAPFLFGIIMMITIAHFSDRSRTRKPFVWPFLLLSGAALLVSFLTADGNFWLAYVFLIAASGGMYAPYGPFFSIMPETLPRNVAGEVIALVNSCGALGAFVGIWLVGWLQAVTGSSRSGLLAMAISLLISGGITLCLPVTAKPEIALS
jgi:sugar phosphate permease